MSFVINNIRVGIVFSTALQCSVTLHFWHQFLEFNYAASKRRIALSSEKRWCWHFNSNLFSVDSVIRRLKYGYVPYFDRSKTSPMQKVSFCGKSIGSSAPPPLKNVWAKNVLTNNKFPKVSGQLIQLSALEIFREEKERREKNNDRGTQLFSHWVKIKHYFVGQLM